LARFTAHRAANRRQNVRPSRRRPFCPQLAAHGAAMRAKNRDDVERRSGTALRSWRFCPQLAAHGAAKRANSVGGA
jgi:hypothetical protein